MLVAKGLAHDAKRLLVEGLDLRQLPLLLEQAAEVGEVRGHLLVLLAEAVPVDGERLSQQRLGAFVVGLGEEDLPAARARVGAPGRGKRGAGGKAGAF